MSKKNRTPRISAPVIEAQPVITTELVIEVVAEPVAEPHEVSAETLAEILAPEPVATTEPATEPAPEVVAGDSSDIAYLQSLVKRLEYQVAGMAAKPVADKPARDLTGYPSLAESLIVKPFRFKNAIGKPDLSGAQATKYIHVVQDYVEKAGVSLYKDRATYRMSGEQWLRFLQRIAEQLQRGVAASEVVKPYPIPRSR